MLPCLQVPNFTKLGWVSAVGAVASLTYSTLAYVLAFVAGKQPTASYAPIPHESPATTVFGAFNAIANIGVCAALLLGLKRGALLTRVGCRGP